MTITKAQILKPTGSSFRYQDLIYDRFPSRWHYHEEYELLYVQQGYGKRFVGDGVENFNEGDLILIGGNIPHFLLSDPDFFADRGLVSHSQVLQFTRDIFPQSIAEMPEFATIVQLLDNSKNGILFTDRKCVDMVVSMFGRFREANNLHRLTTLYEILYELSLCRKIRSISTSTSEYDHISNSENTPLKKAYEYLITHFKDNITLNAIADHAGQNSSALCRNFRKNTGKTLFEVLNEIRIGFACKLLSNSDFLVTDIAFMCGFQNISHFNHKFKEITTLPPAEYRRVYKLK